MLRHLASFVVAIALVLSSDRAAAHDEFRFDGTVVKVERDDALSRTFRRQISCLTLATTDSGRPLLLKIFVTDVTSIERRGKRVLLSAVTPGLRVVVDVSGEGHEDLDALRITIEPAKSAR